MDNNQPEGEGEREQKRLPEPTPFHGNDVGNIQPPDPTADQNNSPQNFTFNVPNSQQDSMGMHQQRMNQHSQNRHPSQFHNPFLPQRVHQFMRSSMPHSYVHQRQQYLPQSSSSQGYPLGPTNEHGGRMPIPNMQSHLPPPPPASHPMSGIQPLPSGHSLSSLINNERNRNMNMFHHQHTPPSQVIERTLEKCITAADFFSQFRREKLDQQGAVHIRGPNCTVNRRSYSSIFMFTQGSKEELLKEQLKETEEKSRKRKKGRKTVGMPQSQGDQQGNLPPMGVLSSSTKSMMPQSDYSRSNDLPKREFHVLRERTDGNGKILIVTIPKTFFPQFDFTNFRITKFCRIYDRTRNVRKQKLFKKEVPKDSFLYYCWPCKDHFLFNKGRFIKMNKHVCRLLPLTLSLKQSKIKKEKGSGKKEEACFQLKMDNLNGNLRAANEPIEVSNATSKEFIVLLEDPNRRVIGFTFFFEYNSGNFHPKRRVASAVSNAAAAAAATTIPPPPVTVPPAPMNEGENVNINPGGGNVVTSEEGGENNNVSPGSARMLPSIISTFPHGDGSSGATQLSFPAIIPQPIRTAGNHGFREDTQKEYFQCRTFDFGVMEPQMFAKVFGHSFKLGVQHHGENEKSNFRSVFEEIVDHEAFEKERKRHVHSNLKRKGGKDGPRRKKKSKKSMPSGGLGDLPMIPSVIPPPDLLGGDLPDLPPAPPPPTIGDVDVKTVADVEEEDVEGGEEKDGYPHFRLIGMSQSGLVLGRDFSRDLPDESDLEIASPQKEVEGGSEVVVVEDPVDDSSIGKKREREEGEEVVNPEESGEPDVKRRKID